MPQFVESLESRRFLSTVTLAAAEAKLASDVSTLISDARHAKSALVADAKAFEADVKALHLKNGPLKTNLQTAVTSARTTIQADVTHVLSTGLKDGQAVVSDVLHITVFDAGKPAEIAVYQKHLAADIKALQTLEMPLINKLTTDVDKAATRIGNAAQAIVTANSKDASLKTDYTNLSNAFESAQQTVTTDLTNLISDLNALSTATT